MADSNNFSDINDNFDTIKTLLNSIRAQGILNTSDVDKLLEGINSKLEKINTEEDIDLIKAFLSELKKNLDERHEVLISKFGAIESLFSNLLKNSTDTVKKDDLREQFDIVATNLSVFSREVVSQKESLTDITLRLDAMRSDDSRKKDIIKSISTVRNDIEKVNNAFDSIVISLNENFKTVLKTISEIDQSEEIKGFADQLTEIVNSSNAILSAIQLIDKKNTQFEDSFEGLATQDDTSAIQHGLTDLSAKSQELINLVDVLTQKSYKLDNLAEKIDASVNIVAGLKADIADKDDGVKKVLIDKLSDLEEMLKNATSNKEFEDFKASLQEVLNGISGGSEELKKSLETALNNISKLNGDIKALDINSNFKNISDEMEKVGEDVKEKFISETDKLSQLMEVNVTRTLQDISSNAEVLNTRIKESHATISDLCTKSFEEVSEGIVGLKKVVAQLDENNVSANNAIFSNITDRLAIFENSLKTSLEKQEDFVSGSSENVFEQITNIKNITDGIDYKLDSNAIEIGNTKKEYKELTESINKVLALDFVDAVKDVKAELYAAKEDLSIAVEGLQTDLSESFSKDLFGKYELLVSKLDSVEDQVVVAQAEAMKSLDTILSNISSSIVDILSYVSTSKESNVDIIDEKLDKTVRFIQDSNLNYVDNVRDIVDVVREQIEANLKNMSAESEKRLDKITSSVTEAKEDVKLDIKTAYDKIVELQGSVGSLHDTFKLSNDGIAANVSEIMESADGLKEDFNSKMEGLKKSISEIIAEFKTDFTCENADNISELKFNAESLHTRSYQQTVDLKNELKAEIAGIVEALKLNILGLTEMVSTTSLNIEGANKEVIDFVKKDFTSEVRNSVDSIKSNTADVLSEIDGKVVDIASGFNLLEKSVNDLSKDTTSALSGALAKILDNFVSLNKALESSDEKSVETMNNTVEAIHKDFEILKKKIAETDSQIDEDLSHQISIIEGNFESLNLMMVDIMNQATDSLGERIKKELSGAAAQMSLSLSEELEQYKVQISDLFDGMQSKNSEQAEFIKSCALELDKVLTDVMEKQNKNAVLQLEEIGNQMKEMIHENVELTSADYDDLKVKLGEYTDRVERQNNILVDTIRAQLDDVAKFVDSNLDIQAQEVNSSFEEISSGVQKVVSTVRDFNNEWSPKITGVQTSLDEATKTVEEKSKLLEEKIQVIIDEELKPGFDNLNERLHMFFEENMLTFVTQNTNSNSKLLEEITAGLSEFKSELLSINERMDKNELSRLDIQQAQIKELQENFNKISEDMKEYSHNEIKVLYDSLIKTNSESRASLTEDIKDFAKHELETLQADLKQSNSEGRASLAEDLKGFTKAELGALQEELKQSNSEGNAVLAKDIKDYTQEELDALKAALDKTDENILNASEGIKEYTKSEINAIYDLINKNNTENYQKVGLTLEENLSGLTEQIDAVIQNSNICKDIILNLVKDYSQTISSDIEKETEAIVGELSEQLSLLKDSHKDDMSSLTNAIEGSLSGYIIDAVNDLKSYMDIKTDSTIIDSKLDSLRTELTKSVDDTTENINKLLQASVFTDAISDLKTTNEILVGTMSEKLTTQIQDFIKANVSVKIDEKIGLLDKKFIDTVVDKYEEVKLLSTQYNKSFENISLSVSDLITKFTASKDDINNNLKILLSGVNKSVDELKTSFAELKAQIMNKSFDEAFHTSVHNQVRGIEDLIKEQMQNIEDISDVCCTNLPEIVELSALVKYNITQSVNNIVEKLNQQEEAFGNIRTDIGDENENIVNELNKLKADIITQFLDIFNQISFISEQEEIIDFIQEKHSELITILSHIVTTSGDIAEVKENVELVDSKLDVLKEDIDLINEKLTSIMSSDGDIDYVYSFRDLETDIANLRLVLNEMKADNKSKEFEELLQSTNNIYQIVDAIKAELPKFEAEEFKKDFNNLAEDIVSISTRTNKLILTSDESYKTLQDNLQDFKLVIDDLDERTRNFAHESGIDKLDYKLASINTMIQNGAQTNQVFNQVFEYLAEWVDRAGEQLATISDKVETLDDIGQIRIMLEDLRAENQDNVDSEELVSALEEVFDRQAKRISSLEAKLDKMIVASNTAKKSKSDLKPIEETLNNFLSVIEGKFLSQQDKISSLETKLEEVVSLVDNKDTAQLTKKVGGMDKQLAKLNKSIEKIASNVVEK